MTSVVNSQLTDSVGDTNAALTENSLATAALYLSAAQKLVNAGYHAVSAQQQNNITAQAAAARGVATILSLKFK